MPDESIDTFVGPRLSHYELCSTGPYSPFRDHETQFGWGVYHKATGKVFAYVGDKGCAHGLSAALNGHFDAAKTFMEGSDHIRASYFDRFLDLSGGVIKRG